MPAAGVTTVHIYPTSSHNPLPETDLHSDVAVLHSPTCLCWRLSGGALSVEQVAAKAVYLPFATNVETPAAVELASMEWFQGVND